MGTPIFEHVTCGRCGGSGKYSYCQMYGTTCFQCAGRTTVLTKRGIQAQAYYRALCCIPAREVKVGMQVIFTDGQKAQVVTAVGYADGSQWKDTDGTYHPYFTIETARTKHGMFEHSPVRIAQSATEKQRKITLALAYQDILLKTGAEMKPTTLKKRSKAHAA